MCKCCLPSWTVFHCFNYNSLVSRPFLTRKVLNRRSYHALYNGQGVVSSIQLLVWSTARSNLGQTRSTLVKLGQIWSKLSELWEMYPGPRFAGFFGMVDLSRVRNGLVKPRSTLGQLWSNLVSLGKTWSDFGKCAPGPVFEVIFHGGPSSDQAGLVRVASFCVPTPEKIPWVKMGL